MFSKLKGRFVTIHELMGNFLWPKMFSPSPDNGELYSLSTQGHSHKVALKPLYVLSAILSIMCRKRAVCDTGWGGWRIPRTREKHQRNTGGTGRDEEM